MRQANRDSTTPLSSLIRDPVVRAAFQRAERDLGRAFAIPAQPRPVLAGGAAEALPEPEVVS
jgi:hypothetical protein